MGKIQFICQFTCSTREISVYFFHMRKFQFTFPVKFSVYFFHNEEILVYFFDMWKSQFTFSMWGNFSLLFHMRFQFSFSTMRKFQFTFSTCENLSLRFRCEEISVYFFYIFMIRLFAPKALFPKLPKIPDVRIFGCPLRTIDIYEHGYWNMVLRGGVYEL